MPRESLVAMVLYMTDDSAPSSPASALEAVLRRVEQEVHLRRRDIQGRLAPLESALTAYRRALEEESARDYATSHSFSQPSTAGVSPARAARNLLQLVQELPELKGALPSDRQSGSPPAGDGALPVSGSPSKPHARSAPHPTGSESAPVTAEGVRPLASALPLVAAACKHKKLLIVGALSGRRRALPEPLEGAAEWIDTGDGGAHATSHLPVRIRQGRIFGVIICEQAISHKHSEPLMAAARSAHVPVGFAGKGGGASIGRALKAIEEQLGGDGSV